MTERKVVRMTPDALTSDRWTYRAKTGYAPCLGGGVLSFVGVDALVRKNTVDNTP